MSKEEYLKWLEYLESQGLDDAEIESVVQDYLDQPESTEWFHDEN